MIEIILFIETVFIIIILFKDLSYYKPKKYYIDTWSSIPYIYLYKGKSETILYLELLNSSHCSTFGVELLDKRFILLSKRFEYVSELKEKIEKSPAKIDEYSSYHKWLFNTRRKKWLKRVDMFEKGFFYGAGDKIINIKKIK